MIAVLIPVLDRPQRVAPMLESLAAASRVIECAAVFLCSPGDTAEIVEVDGRGAHRLTVPWEPGRGDYARKINYGVAHTDQPFVFLAADDLRFRPGWAERAVACWYETGACVVGTNDLGNPRVRAGRHSTHSLVHRDYLGCGTADGEPLLLHEGYWHNFVDDELVQTAVWRQTYAHATDSIVEHLHPSWRKGSGDATYARGKAHYDEDRGYFERRKRLWGPA